ncbi:MAG: fused MFS/spermidine synthase [Bryobacterales bacterium]|nr:fused MFS/spermidine synthase [Bryobacterales bacterium]
MFLFGPAVVLSAFLLFLVQPLAGKHLLPHLGGSAAVWSACLLFFQTALLAGYLYAHALTRWLRPRQQAIAHSTALLACILLPRSAIESGPGASHLIASLARSIGLPYLILSATSPLLMHWYSLTHPNGRPYRLSAWSNAACAAALLSFPFFWEARFGLRQLDQIWFWTFVAEALLLIATAAGLYQANPAIPPRPLISGTPWQDRVRWLAWPALGAGFLMATSTHLCQVVVPAPLLWVLPLLVYLLSFVWVFERDRYSPIPGAAAALGGLLLMTGALLYFDLQAELIVKVILYTTGLFLICVFAHGELARRKPAPARLTSFWSHVAAGSALGSFAAGSLSPMIFKGYFELPLLMAATAALCLWRLRAVSRYARQAAAFTAILAATPALAHVTGYYSGLIASGRNFYGTLRVLDEGRTRKLLHGQVTHGSQFLDAPRDRQPTAYYGPQSGAGLLLSRPGTNRHIGVIGLGTGTLATYGRPGDVMRFYEINPLVIQMARLDFRYLRQSEARIEIVEGDARLRLFQEPPQRFDSLIVDAFSGDSIPMHLLTREAMALYFRHLTPDGTLAIHVSNQFLNLEPAVHALAADSGRVATTIAGKADPASAVLASTWILIPNPLPPTPPPSAARVWTDDWNSLLPALR